MTLSQFLVSKNLTFVAFAKTIGTTPVSVRRYAEGERIPKPEIMSRITEATKGKVTANDFYQTQ